MNKITRLKNKLYAILVLGLLVGPVATHATTIVTSVGGDNYQATFDSMTFTMQTADTVSAIVFEDFYSSVAPSCGSYVSGAVATSVNGGASQALTGNTCTGAYNFLNDVDGNDLLVTIFRSFSSNFGPVSVGDTVTVSSAGYVFSLPGLNPAANSEPFSAFLVNNNFERISNFTTTAVPLPTAFWLFGSGLLGLLGIAKRKKA